MNILTLAMIVFIACLFIRIPIGYTIAFTCFAMIIFDPTIEFSFYASSVYNMTNSVPMLAIPFFMFAGEIMGTGGIAKRLVAFGQKLIGNMYGSLGIILVFGCAFFAAISGSAPATVAAIGGIIVPMMLKEGYPRNYSSALAAAGGTLGPVIPPSIIMVVYGVMTNTSIVALFMAGIVPGLLMALTLIVYNVYYCKKKGYGKPISKMLEAEETTKALQQAKTNNDLSVFRKMSMWQVIKYSWLSLLAPVIILGGIYGGIFTATEAGVISIVYSFIISYFVYRELKLSDLWRMAKNAVSTSCSVLVIVGPALLFGRMLAFNQVPLMISDFLMGIISSKWMFLVLCNIFFLIVGCFMEALAAIMIFAPLFVQLAAGYGISPIHFGVILTVNLVIGLCTPPVGINLFVACKIGNEPLHKLIKPVIPMVIVMIVDLMLISYIEPIAMFLPSILL